MGSRSSKPSLTAPPSADFNTPWRKVDWTKTEQLKDELRGIQLNHPQLQHLRILLHGPVGAGKSCFINSLQSVFQGEIKAIAYEQSFAKKSCTRTSKLMVFLSWGGPDESQFHHIVLMVFATALKNTFKGQRIILYKTYRIITNNSETLPFICNDVMGLEATEEDGMHPEDVVNAMLGHIKDGYKFNPTTPISAEDQGFIREPSLQDKVHCLVSVVPANSISRMEYGVISKMGIAGENAKRLGIPHVVIMTKVDEDVCPLVQKDLTQIYKSRKIKEKMRNCSDRLGPPMKCVFPISNYHEETEIDNNKDVLILMALLYIVKVAKDYVKV